MKQTVKAWMPVVDGLPAMTGFFGRSWNAVYPCFISHETAMECGWGDAQEVTITYNDGHPRRRKVNSRAKGYKRAYADACLPRTTKGRAKRRGGAK